MSAVGVPAGTEVPSAGDVIVRCGASFGPRTRIEIDAWPWRPSSSMAIAVIVWVPIESCDAVMFAPLASAPSRSELHCTRPLMLPSSTSVALPLKPIGPLAAKNAEPLAGAVMRTTGAFSTVSVICAWPVSPPASATRAVIVWMPERSDDTVRPAPVPSGPSRLELHWIWLARLPFSASVAVPVKVTAVPGRTLEPLGGAVMRTNGAWFSPSVRMSCGWPLAASRLL